MFSHRLFGFSKCAESLSIGIFQIDRLSDSSEAELLVADSNGWNVTVLGAVARSAVCLLHMQVDPRSTLMSSTFPSG